MNTDFEYCQIKELHFQEILEIKFYSQNSILSISLVTLEHLAFPFWQLVSRIYLVRQKLIKTKWNYQIKQASERNLVYYVLCLSLLIALQRQRIKQYMLIWVEDKKPRIKKTI